MATTSTGNTKKLTTAWTVVSFTAPPYGEVAPTLAPWTVATVRAPDARPARRPARHRGRHELHLGQDRARRRVHPHRRRVLRDRDGAGLAAREPSAPARRARPTG